MTGIRKEKKTRKKGGEGSLGRRKNKQERRGKKGEEKRKKGRGKSVEE